jgi:hypothetical protein
MAYLIDDLLGGAQRGRMRPRGFINWRPDRNSQKLLDQIRAVLAEYADHLPLTIRQVFYRLVVAYKYPKTEADYKRLCVKLQMARRARLVNMEDIRDDGNTILIPGCYASVEDFLASMRAAAARFTLDRTAGQKRRLVVMCEAAGMTTQLERVAEPYGITVISGGGFDSVTLKHQLADELERPTEILHIGDHDASGCHLFLAIAEDVTAFASEEVDFTRLAVTPDQITRYRLPTAPAKPSDKRAFRGQTCQAEALPPDVLANILRTAITDRLDMRAYNKVLKAERAARRTLQAKLTQ